MAAPTEVDFQVGTDPYCASCGWDYKRQPDLAADGYCDACGAVLLYSAKSGEGPTNPPSVPSIVDSTGGVATATWTAAPNFDSYVIQWRVNGDIVATVPNATTPETYTAEVGDEVCVRIAGITDGIGSGYSAWDCVTLA